METVPAVDDVVARFGLPAPVRTAKRTGCF